MAKGSEEMEQISRADISDFERSRACLQEQMATNIRDDIEWHHVPLLQLHRLLFYPKLKGTGLWRHLAQNQRNALFPSEYDCGTDSGTGILVTDSPISMLRNE